MPSRADTLTLAIQAITEARSTLQEAREGEWTTVEPPVLAQRAVLVLEHQADRLRRSFNLPTG